MSLQNLLKSFWTVLPHRKTLSSLAALSMLVHPACDSRDSPRGREFSAGMPVEDTYTPDVAPPRDINTVAPDIVLDLPEVGQQPSCIDADNDTFYSTGNCGTPQDCNDADWAIFPSAEERCDEIDNNCDGQTDEGVKQTYFLDLDRDGHGDIFSSLESCPPPRGYVLSSDDCNDNEATVFPGAPELCDKKDNDCNKQYDEGCDCVAGEAQECGPSDLGECRLGTQECLPDGTWGECDDYIDRVAEVCDGLDNDCDGFVDDGVLRIFYRDRDGDGRGDDLDTTEGCDAPPGYVATGGDCDDSNAQLWQLLPAYLDNDQDRFGRGNLVFACSGNILPEGYALNDQDCNDDNAAIFPGADELCDRVDNNCNRSVDEGYDVGLPCFVAEGECRGEGTYQCAQNQSERICTIIAREQPPELCDGLDNDCDPRTEDGSGEEPPLINPQVGNCLNHTQRCLDGQWQNDYAHIFGYEAEEVSCDELDNDCDGLVDEGVLNLFYRDNDGDGLGNHADSIESCLVEPGFVDNDQDCDDEDANIRALAQEVLDDFNRPDNAALGANTAGQLWEQYGVHRWSIHENSIYVHWTGGNQWNPNASSRIGHRDTFNLVARFSVGDGPVGGGGTLFFAANCTGGSYVGNLECPHAVIADDARNVHGINSGGIATRSNNFLIEAGISYMLRYSYDGHTLALKLWPDGIDEPVDSLLSVEAQNDNQNGAYLTVFGSLNGGRENTLIVDYIMNETCRHL